MIYVPIKRGYLGLYIRKFLPPNLPIHDKSSTCLSHVLYLVLMYIGELDSLSSVSHSPPREVRQAHG